MHLIVMDRGSELVLWSSSFIELCLILWPIFYCAWQTR